jgi:hypothetical protein
MIRNNDEKLLQLRERNITKVLNRVHYGEDEQADDKYLVLKPSNWPETDPFLLMAEDWFSTNGFDWHPHRGIETITRIRASTQPRGPWNIKTWRCTVDDSRTRNYTQGDGLP